MRKTTFIAFYILIGSIALAEGPTREELEMAARSPEYRTVAEQFVAAAAAKDSAKLEQLLSPALSARTGKEPIQKVSARRSFPSSPTTKKLAAPSPFTNTTDATGNSGFAFYMYSVPKSGQAKPFVIYVLEENGRKVVGNILVNRYVEGRHQ